MNRLILVGIALLTTVGGVLLILRDNKALDR
ncbi:membrane protein [Microbacterium phage Zooman]|nr:membrane protein [Microbacterium phage Zooman]